MRYSMFIHTVYNPNTQYIMDKLVVMVCVDLIMRTCLNVALNPHSLFLLFCFVVKLMAIDALCTLIHKLLKVDGLFKIPVGS